MIRKIALLASIALAASTVAQPARWQLQSPGTTLWPINDLAMISPDHGFFCADNEELWETHDRGRTWTNRIRYSGFAITGNELYSLGFFDDQHGFLISNAEQPARFTTDGGQTWHYASGAPYGREYFDILSPTQAFLGGWQFSTTNSGASWTMSSLNPLTADLGRIFSFDMRDAQVGLMASETYNPPIIAGTYRTTNGGQSWTRVGDWGAVLWLPDGTALNARPYPTDPWPTERGAQIHRSTDAGVTWEMIADHVAPGFLDQQQGFLEWCALDSNTICGVTLSGKVWRSVDAGVTWTLTQPIDLIRGPVPDTAMGIRAFGQQVWLFAEMGIAMRSDDGGLTWTMPASGVGLDVSEISMRDEQVGLAAAGGFVLRTTDGGQYWTPTRLNVEGVDDILPQDRDLMEGYRHIAWASPTTVYLIGGAGNFGSGRFLMWKSADAGLTWQYVYGLENDIRITHFDCSEVIWIDENNAYLLGYDTDPFGVGPSGYKTTDGGQTWTWLNSLLQSAVYDVDFVDVNHGWILFTQSDSAYTSDGGASWTVVPMPGMVEDIDMADLNTGYAVGALGEIYKTTNGGRSWQLRAGLPEVEQFLELETLSPTEVVALGRDNTDQTHLRFFTRRTTDGGLTWTRDDVPENWNSRYLWAHHLDVLPGNRVWVAGQGGLIGSNTTQSLPGDVDGDDDVDLTDLAHMLSAFGSCVGHPGFNATADFDASGCVELGDLAVLLTNFGT